MVDVSVVIVNYKVKHFLEVCLHSVIKASGNLNVEILIVDNCSGDGSCEHIQTHFPEVELIENKENVGFSKANNQAINMAKGRFVLILNPDTIIAEDTLDNCVAFMNQYPDAGALGVPMIDGSGVYLKESKRSLPSPWVAFYKIFGLSAIFPQSKIFARYHLGFLNSKENWPVEVLSGAFMFMRKEVLDKIGLFDESFFMYGEDIDLSYRVILGGYKNYYFAGTQIIHFKGESTKKGSLNYVVVFYRAMEIFALKHFTSHRARPYHWFINIAIWLRAALAITSRLAGFVVNPFIKLIHVLRPSGQLKTVNMLWIGSLMSLEVYKSKKLSDDVPISFKCFEVQGCIDTQLLMEMLTQGDFSEIHFMCSDLPYKDIITVTGLLNKYKLKVKMIAPFSAVAVGSGK
jgi:GT2 family glycosyltransferase